MKKIIGRIGNYYGRLEVKKEDKKYYWAIVDPKNFEKDDWNGFFWEEISVSLYKELLNHNETTAPKEAK